VERFLDMDSGAAAPADATESHAWAALEQITDSALAYLSLEDLLLELLERIRIVLDVDTAAILLHDPQRNVLVARAARGIEEEVRQGVMIPLGRGFAGRIAAEGRAVAVEDVDHADIMNPILRLKGIRSLLGVPLLVEGRVVGVLHVGSLVHRTFDEDDVRLLQAAGDRAALAIDNAQLSEQRAVTEVLQRYLLPARLPQIPGLRISAKYQPAHGARVGGDWYDVFTLPDSSVALAIGDVTGRGVLAAAAMAEIRTALRAYAMLRQPLGEVLQRLNWLMLCGESRLPVTVALFALDLDASELVGVNAGHPPALMLCPDGRREFVVGASGPPLGTRSSTRYEVERIPFPTGSRMLLYTDGLIERRGDTIDVGLERLRKADLERHPSLPLADGIFALLATEEAPEDDVAVLAVESQPLGDVFRLTLEADPMVLSLLRRSIARWLSERGVSEERQFDITTACSEAAANAIEHAYPPRDGAFTVEARPDGDAIVVTVRDHGTWRPAAGRTGGKGLEVMRALVDDVAIDRESTGTTVTLHAVRR
jgi:serine phosphatase RsbU (regulator of sigma subunit)/anti-sigma regulatory factor (Ser/Thr protein kinase)